MKVSVRVWEKEHLKPSLAGVLIDSLFGGSFDNVYQHLISMCFTYSLTR